jgi:hypothetical protein
MALVVVFDCVLLRNLGELLKTEIEMLLGASFYDRRSLYLDDSEITWLSLIISSSSCSYLLMFPIIDS